MRVAVLVVIAVAALAVPVAAELENQVFTSKPDRVRVVVPRGWRATDQPSYPGLLLWMLRNQPDGKIVLTAQPFTHDLYCGWPPACRSSHESLPTKFACALGQQLKNLKMTVSPVQPGPRENEEAGLPTVWFEYDDGKHFFRQAVAVSEDRAISLVLSASSVKDRTSHVRAFEQTLRTLRPLTAEELGIPTPAAAAAAAAAPVDAGVPVDANVAPAPSFETAPAATAVNPVGPCTK